MDIILLQGGLNDKKKKIYSVNGYIMSTHFVIFNNAY